MAERTARAAGGAAVLHHRWAHPRATVVGCRGPLRAPPARRARASGVGSRRTSCATPTRLSSPARVSRSTSSVSSGTPTSARRRSTSRPSTRGDHRRRPRPPCADDVCERGVATLSDRIASGSAPGAPASPGRKRACVPLPPDARGRRPQRAFPARRRKRSHPRDCGSAALHSSTRSTRQASAVHLASARPRPARAGRSGRGCRRRACRGGGRRGP
jgi:hypothetical protein